MTTETLIVRADASAQVGSGHIMRCLALAQAWQDQGGMVQFVCHETLPPALHRRLRNENIDVRIHSTAPGSAEDAAVLIDIATGVRAPALVIDGYRFGADYQRRVKDAGLRMLFIDDNGHADHYCADWVLNQNIHADARFYASREPYTRLLLGTDYTLLRREFRNWRGPRRTIPDTAQHILVTMGGGDPDNITLTVLRAIAQMPEADQLRVRAVVGGGNPHRESIEQFARRTAFVEVLYDVRDMPGLMAWADLAVSAGGSTIWELCRMGVPTLVIVTAENQIASASRLAEKTQVKVLGLDSALSEAQLAAELREAMQDRCYRESIADSFQRLVDGHGAERVVERIRCD